MASGPIFLRHQLEGLMPAVQVLMYIVVLNIYDFYEYPINLGLFSEREFTACSLSNQQR